MTSHLVREMLDWTAQKADFVPDGALRDIYVEGTSIDDWRRTLALLFQGPYRTELRLGETRVSAPEDVASLFMPEGERFHLLFWVGDVDVACHFFSYDEIEFDFVPNLIDEPKLSSLLHFMLALGSMLKKVVIMTPENFRTAPIFRYSPDDDQMTWIPPAEHGMRTDRS